MALTLSTRRDGDDVTLAVEGDIDIATADDLERAIAAATGGDAATVVVDLTGVRFMDSAGINALLRGRRAADAHDKPYRVTGASGMVQQILEVTGVAEHLLGHSG